ncbi:MAG: serine hydrolase [Reichenbachiella sp.]
MQTYVEYNCLRSFQIGVRTFVLATLMSMNAWANMDGNGEKELARDSLFQRWNKNKSTLPFMIYDLRNFDSHYQRIEAESLVNIYGIGGIYLNNGDIDELIPWLQSLNATADVDPMLIVKVTHVFELPFDIGIEQPSHFKLECLSDTLLINELAIYHADLLNSLGVDGVHFENFPNHYLVDEKQKVQVYLSKLIERGIMVSLGREGKRNINEIGWDNIQWLDYDLAKAEDYKTERKSRKKFRKSTGYSGLIVATLDEGTFYDDKKNKMVKGANMLVLPHYSDPQFVINNILVSGVLRKNHVKQSSKIYYEKWKEIKDEKPSYQIIEFLASMTVLNRKINSASITLVMDQNNEIPIRKLNGQRFYSFSSGVDSDKFRHQLDLYKQFRHLNLDDIQNDSLLSTLDEYSTVIIDLTSIQSVTQLSSFIGQLSKFDNDDKLIVIYQGNRFALSLMPVFTSVIWSPDLNENIKLEMVQSIFGAHSITGKLPSYLTDDTLARGVERASLKRIAYSNPDYMDLDETKFIAIDSVVSHAIKDQVIPGCQILMIKDGTVVYNKSYGYMTYDSLNKVQWDNIYDIASVTKTTATVPMIMNEIENGHISLTGHLGDYLYEYEDSDKSELAMTDLLTHQSGLKSYIPFWRHASFEFDSAMFYYKKPKGKRRRSYDYVKVNWSDSINHWIADSKYNSLKQEDDSYKYLYSDLGFMIMKELVEEQNSMSFDKLTDSLLYSPLAMEYTTYNPLARFDSSMIVPTSNDPDFRDVLLRGQVHDRNAALLGGVSGHAGLFSNANDLGKYMQMMLQQGFYGGNQYFDSTLVKTFTSKLTDQSTRGLGWDKPRRSVGNVSKYASDEAFGHSGFTGTLVWADPEYDLVYVFLSNRIYPDSQNYKLIKQNTRTVIHDLMYESFLSEEKIVNP